MSCGGQETDAEFESVAQELVNRTAEFEEFELCKIGSSATFDYTVHNLNTGVITNNTITVADGQCVILGRGHSLGTQVTVTEVGAQTGFQYQHAVVTTISRQPGGTTTTNTRIETSPTVSELVSGSRGGPLRGALVEYYNVRSQGCQPNKWAPSFTQQSLASLINQWPPSVSQTAMFDATFGVTSQTIPNRDLLFVIRRGGVGERGLQRHAVAALLNASHPGIIFPHTPSQVIQMVQAAYAANDFNTTFAYLASINEKFCPLLP